MAAWNAVLAVANECDQLHPDDPAITAMLSEARGVLDRTQDITRTQMTPIYAFPNATLTKAVLQGEDMYVLDSGNQQVYRITLATDGMSVLPGSYTPIPSMRRSGKVINFDVSDLIDIAWADNGAGLAQSNVITALDKNGVLIGCPPRFLQDCTAQKLQGSETWKTPATIQFWQGRLYLLDAGANQIWRYDPSGGAFAGMPLEYFSGSNRPDITNAVDFSINTAGDLYLVTATGQVARFRGGEQQDFAFSGFGTQTMNAPDCDVPEHQPDCAGAVLHRARPAHDLRDDNGGHFYSRLPRQQRRPVRAACQRGRRHQQRRGLRAVRQLGAGLPATTVGQT